MQQVDHHVGTAGNDVLTAAADGAPQSFDLSGYVYDITTNDGNVAAGKVLSVYAGHLNATDSFTVDGSAETDWALRIFGGLGTDHLIGGTGNDGFYFGPEASSAMDRVDGGEGSQDQLALDGNYTMTIGGNITNVASLALLPGASDRTNTFNLKANDALVAAGKTMPIWALNVVNPFVFNGSAETNGRFRIIGGQTAASIHGGAQDDVIWGGRGGDTLYGGGHDAFLYNDTNQSILAAPDEIMDFASGDHIDLSGIMVGGVHPAFTCPGTLAFDGHAGEFRIEQLGPSVFQLQADLHGNGVAYIAINIHVADGHLLAAADVIVRWAPSNQCTGCAYELHGVGQGQGHAPRSQASLAVSLLQLFAGGDPAGRADVRAVPAVLAERGRPAVRAWHRHLP